MNSVSGDEAGFWTRLPAHFIDGMATYLIGYIIGYMWGTIDGNLWVLILMGFLVGIIYGAGFESSKLQATPGKLIVGVKVIDYEGNRVSFGRAVGRSLAKYLSWLILGIGFLMVGWTPKKQGLHDIIACTFVVYNNTDSS